MTVAEWYFLQGSQQAGPFTREQIHSLFSSASIDGNTLVWRPGYADWSPLSNFAEFKSSPPPPSLVARQDESISRATPEQAGGAQNGPPALNNSKQWVDQTPHPWRRYFARAVDNFFWALLLMMLLGIGLAFYDPQLLIDFESLFEGPGGRVADIILSLILCIIPNAILIGLTGGNLGKWLFGICVLDHEDRPIGLLRAFQREIRVFVFGLGLGIPIITLITNIMAYQKLKADGATSWDHALNLRVVHRKNGPAQYVGAVAGIAVLIGLFVLMVWLNTL